MASSFAGRQVRKKNLTSSTGYQFRVRPASTSDNNKDDESTNSSRHFFSPPSQIIVPFGLSDGMKRWFQSLEHQSLLKRGEQGTDQTTTISLEDALGGKEFVLLYASASWCGPCRNFTPQLAQWYKSLVSSSSSNQDNWSAVEIVSLSADHNEAGFRQYYTSSMPWLAVDYEEDARRGLMGAIRVTGIPRLSHSCHGHSTAGRLRRSYRTNCGIQCRGPTTTGTPLENTGCQCQIIEP